MKRFCLFTVTILLATIIITAGCGKHATASLVPIKLMLDWVPNTNHTGIFIAQVKGYFKDAGLAVDIIQPGEVYPEAAVASGATDFGISFQESVTLARNENVPIVSIAAVLQHNTSGFASPSGLKVTNPAGFTGLTYGSFGTPFEAPTLKVLMRCAGSDFSQLKIVDTGSTDPLALLAENKIDLAWIFYGWQGIQAQQQGISLNVVMMKDYFNCIPDYYTPVVIASELTIANRPEVVRAFLKALSRGYDFAKNYPDQAATILTTEVPELDVNLVKASQEWLSPYYKAEAPRWGEQKESVWQNYVNWMVTNGILAKPIDVSKAYTNKFLP